MATVYVPKGRTTFYIGFSFGGKRITQNTKIPRNKKAEALKFKKEFEAHLTTGAKHFMMYERNNHLKLREEIQKYINTTRTNWSKGKFNNVTTTLKLFKEYIGEDINISEISSFHLSEYIRERKLKVSTTSLRSDLQILRTFFNYLVDEDLIVKSPLSKKLIPKPELRSVVTFRENDLKKIMEYSKENDPIFYRFLYLLGSTGARPSDILNLRVGNINLDENIMVIKISKTSREVSFPIYNRLRTFFEIEISDVLKLNKEELIFRDMRIHTVGRKFRELKKRLSLNDYYNLKTFRKTLATKLIENQLDGTNVAFMLGHTSVNTTSKYYLNRKADTIRKYLNSIEFNFG